MIGENCNSFMMSYNLFNKFFIFFANFLIIGFSNSNSLVLNILVL